MTIAAGMQNEVAKQVATSLDLAGDTSPRSTVAVEVVA